jgi:prefoldin subunit 5
MTDELHRDVGRHDAEIASLQREIAELRTDVRSILTTLAEARGGWKTLMAVGGLAGAVGALATKLALAFGVIK